MLKRENFPFLFLLLMSVCWAYFYQASHLLNGYSLNNPEWPILVDSFIVLPIVCFLCIKDKKAATIKSLAYICLMILLGSFIIPESSKLIWHYLESGRYLLLVLFVLLELVTILTIIFAIKASLATNKDPDLAIAEPIEKMMGKGFIANLVSFETRIWTYLLFAKKIKTKHFHGIKHFYCHNKDGTQSNLLGFIMLIIFEMPILHLLLHFLWSATAANTITLLTLFGLIFFIAEYRAIAIRPISLDKDKLIIRFGVWQPLIISYHEIETIAVNSQFIRRAQNTKRFNLSGNPNIKIKLHCGKLIYLGLDMPDKFINSYQSLS